MQNLQRFQWFVLLVLLQVLVFNHVHINQYATPLFYIYFILKFDSDTGRKELMTWAFFIGLAVDIFSNTPGMNAAASVLLAFTRPLLLRSQLLRASTDIFSPGIHAMGFSPFFRYVLAGTFLHALAFDVLDTFSFLHLGTLFVKVFTDVAITLLLIMGVDTIRRKKGGARL